MASTTSGTTSQEILCLPDSRLGKTCSQCQVFKAMHNFALAKLGFMGRAAKCKGCKNFNYTIYKGLNQNKLLNQAREWRRNNREKANKSSRAWGERNKDRQKAYLEEYRKLPETRYKEFRRALKRNHAMEIECYNTIFELQNGQCLICATHQSELSRPLFVDHNHSTGAIRALLCTHCNSALGMVKEDQRILESMIGYLEIFNG